MAVAFTGCLIIIVCRLIRMLSACNDAGDMVLLPTQVASLSCPCQPQTDYIYINESSNAITPTTYYNEFNVVDMCDNGAIACIVITFSDTLAYNSTQIRCTHSDSNYPNDVASYFVAGPPLSPSPSVLVINTSALLLQWEEPFTWKGVADIIYYTVRMYNVSAHKWMRWDIPALLHGNLYCASSDGNGLFNTNCSEETNVDAVTNTTVQFIFTTTSIPFYRDELIFFVSASNIVGESERAAVRGWIKSASYNNNMKVLITPLQQADNEVAVLIISIQFPSSCIPQTTNLNISVRNMQNLSSHGVLKQIPIEGSPNDWITFRPHLDLIMNGVIEVIVTASTSEGNAYASISSWHPPAAKRNAQAEFEEHHIAGAVFVDLEAIKDQSNPLPIMFPGVDQLEQQFSQLGISNNDHVIVYDNNSDVGMLSAPRVWVMFQVYGHKKVSILDGGLPKWIASGYPTVSGVTPVSPTNFKASYNSDAVYSMQALLDNCSSKNRQVLDARPKGRFDGTVPEANPSWYSGHILGSINIPFTSMLDPTTKLFKTKDAIQQTFQQYGVNLDQPAVTLCSTGMTASFLVLGAHILGKEVPLYDGAWAEWHQKAPKETMKLGVRGSDLNK